MFKFVERVVDEIKSFFGRGIVGRGLLSGRQTDVKSFSTIAVSGQNNVVADLYNDTLTLEASGGTIITTNDATDTITIYSGSSGSGSTVEWSVTQNAHGFSVGDILKSDQDGTYSKAQADSEANAEVAGIVSEDTDENTFKICSNGKVTLTSHGFSGPALFLSAATAGLLTDTTPSTDGQVNKPVAIVIDANTIEVLILRGMVVSSDEYGAVIKTITQADHGFSTGNALRYSGTEYVEALADSAANSEVCGIVSESLGDDTFNLCTEGFMPWTGHGLGSSGAAFLSPTSAGALTATAPSTAGQISKPCVIMHGANLVEVKIMRGMVVGNAPAAHHTAHEAGGADAIDALKLQNIGIFYLPLYQLYGGL